LSQSSPIGSHRENLLAIALSSIAQEGLVLGAYAAGVGVGGDGFLAAFTAGFAVTILDREVCDCFLEFGEAAAEIAMLLAFVMFGVVISDSLGLLP
jgi:hypothetical protein